MINIKHKTTGATLRTIDADTLSGANLRCANLRCANLRGSDLSGSDLSGSDLRYANLIAAELCDADLSYANLRYADLSYANLSGSDLRGANLPEGYRIARIDFGGWPVTVTPTQTTISCQVHANELWLAADPRWIAAMHTDATTWWAKHGVVVQAAIRAMQE